MNEPSNRDELSAKLEQECSIRRATKLLEAKRSRIYDELNQMISYLKLLVPISNNPTDNTPTHNDLMLEAARRLDDPLFSKLLVQIIQRRENPRFWE